VVYSETTNKRHEDFEAMSVAPPFTIAPLGDPAEFTEVEEIQRQAWNLVGDELEVVPAHNLIALAHNSGVMLGCRDATGRMVGFVYSFLAFEDGPQGRVLKQHSHQMGVVPQARGFGLGRLLKLGQREATLAQGVGLITWTYDPLEPINARLNIGQLRAIARRYHRNYYGDLGGINAGIPTDRFEVEWLLASARVQAAAERKAGPPDVEATFGARVLAAGRGAGELPVPAAEPLPLDGPPFAVEVPANFQLLKQADHALAVAWRAQSQRWFEQAFAAGYAVTEAWGAAGRAFYGLERISNEPGVSQP
jgi:predicted GNAT superfamily acetyltransferase